MSRETDLRERVQTATKRPSRKKVWEAPVIADFAQGLVVLALDQSLSSTGWVRFDIGATVKGRLTVWNRGTIKVAVASKGHTSTMDKADILKARLEANRSIMASDLQVAEVTPVVGYRLESSLVAGYVTRQVFPGVHFVSRQSALALLLPPDKREEKIHSKIVKDLYVPLLGDAEPRRWNEHQRDALMLGLTALWKIQQEGQ